jgi:putative ABC transport system permease protein
MNAIALRMLTGDLAKYLGMVFGVAFSTLLIVQQASLFLGLVERAATTVRDTREADVWVMDPRIDAVDNLWPLPDTALDRVRGVAGVDWAAPFLRAQATLVGKDLPLQTAALFGLDDTTLAGLPLPIVAGAREDLFAPGAVMMDRGGWQFLFGNRPFTPGLVIELNDRRAVVVGLVDAGAQFSSQVALYTRYAEARGFAPGGRNRLSFVIVGAAPGADPQALAATITRQTGLKALASADFARASSDYVIFNTGIPISFGTVVALGIVVGMVVVGLTFSLFVRDNLKQFGALKAIGVPGRQLVAMVLAQGATVGVQGYAIGLGAATLLVHGGAQNALAWPASPP